MRGPGAKEGLPMAMTCPSSFGQGLEPWISSRELGDVRSELTRLFGTSFRRPPRGAAAERAWAPFATASSP